ncbi:hypothetical protein BJF91_15860 [Allorhizobium taibaishanense]|uniref:Uncharacterized protein n=1 Tax=Allorhizobium taibaishanense TaxID=887144 RepID=A0A1Q9A9G6_9HYPH|nr:hypothetical protein BJF91_15860 [Allorhizobium taibaishanense]
MAEVYTQCLGETAGAGTEQPRIYRAAPGLHALKPPGRRQRTDQHGATGSADNVKAPVNAIGAVDIDMTGGAKHSAVALSRATEAMGGGIVRLVGFGFDDHTAYAIKIQSDADQFLGNINSRSRKVHERDLTQLSGKFDTYLGDFSPAHDAVNFLTAIQQQVELIGKFQKVIAGQLGA